MPLTQEDKYFLRGVFQNSQDRPLEPGDPRYEPLYASLGADDPVEQLSNSIGFSGVESRQLFSGFRGSGKSTELLRLKQSLEEQGYRVYYANALDYLNPALPVDITDVLILLAGAFSDSVREAEGLDIAGESYWDRFWHYLNNTQVKLEGFDLGLFKDAARLKVSLKDVPSFRQRIQEAMSLRLSELESQVKKFFEDYRKAISLRHTNSGIVFLFDNLEQLRGNALSEEQEVISSVEKLFSQHLDRLSIPYFHVVYTVPPWLRFAIPGMPIEILPSIVQWKNDAGHTPNHSGDQCLLQVIRKRFGDDGFARFFQSEESALALVRSCGGSIRDLLFLLRQTILSANSLPVAESTIASSIRKLRDSFLLVSTEEALWLARVAKSRTPELPDRSSSSISQFTLFVDTHLVLFLRNGQEWYDVHPLVREHVEQIARREAEKVASN
jgi:hypothetical protein